MRGIGETWGMGDVERNERVLREVEEIIAGGLSKQSVLDRLVRLLRERFPHYSWVGFYLLRDGTLELGPWSGRDPQAHAATIPLGKGIQGLAASRAETVLLPDLRQDPRYLACFPAALSEIVVPIKEEGTVYGEIDVDAKKVNAFDQHDRRLLEGLAERLVSFVRPQE